MTKRELNDNELTALQAFAAHYGRKWKDELAFTYWYNARLFCDRAGKEYPELHRLRNDLGPKWLASFNLPIAA